MNLHMLTFLMLLIYDHVFAQTIVDTCPLTKNLWEGRAAVMACRGEDAYHCIRVSKHKFAEMCIRIHVLDPKDGCPRIDLNGNLDQFEYDIHCEPAKECPKKGDSLYASEILYKYPGCFGADSVQTSLHQADALLNMSIVHPRKHKQLITTSRNTIDMKHSQSSADSAQGLQSRVERIIGRIATGHYGPGTTIITPDDDGHISIVWTMRESILGGGALFLILVGTLLTIVLCFKRHKSRNGRKRENGITDDVEDEEQTHAYNYVDESDVLDGIVLHRLDTEDKERNQETSEGDEKKDNESRMSLSSNSDSTSTICGSTPRIFEYEEPVTQYEKLEILNVVKQTKDENNEVKVYQRLEKKRSDSPNHSEGTEAETEDNSK